MKAQSKCYCGGHMVAVTDSESGLPRIKCDSPQHGRSPDHTPIETRRVVAPDGTIHIGLVVCQDCAATPPTVACNCGRGLCNDCWKSHRKTCQAA